MIIKTFDLEDIFLLSEIINKMELEIDTDKLIKNTQTTKLENLKDAKALGKEVIVGISIDLSTKFVRNLYKAKNEVKQLIVNLTGLNEEAVSKMKIKDIIKFFEELVSHEDFKDFLSSAEEPTK